MVHFYTFHFMRTMMQILHVHTGTSILLQNDICQVHLGLYVHVLTWHYMWSMYSLWSIGCVGLPTACWWPHWTSRSSRCTHYIRYMCTILFMYIQFTCTNVQTGATLGHTSSPLNIKLSARLLISVIHQWHMFVPSSVVALLDIPCDAAIPFGSTYTIYIVVKGNHKN